MKALLLASTLLAIYAPHKANVQVNVDAKNGDVITGDHHFRVTVQSDDPVTQVEFYVGSELRSKDTSTPYEFTLDSLAEQDGDLQLKFKAYTTKSATGETTIKVKIDNGVSKGAQYHIDQGTADLSNSKWDDAITEGRIALKADPKSNGARLVLARAYLGKGDTANAQRYAEDAADADPSDSAALNLLSGINLQAAFNAVTAAGGNRKDTLNTIRDAMKSAIDARRKVLDAAVDKAGQPTENTLIQWADTALRAFRFNLAIPPLKDQFEKNQQNTAVGDRLAYAYLRLGRTSDATNVLLTMEKQGTPSTFGYAALAIVKAEAGDVAGSDDEMKQALLSDPSDPVVLGAQAYIALKFVRYQVANTLAFNLNYDDATGKDAQAAKESRATLQKLVDQLEQAQQARTETLYYKEALYNKLGIYNRAQQAFQAAVLAEPANYDAYIEAGNRSLASTQLSNLPADDKQQALDYSEIMFNAALEARPDSAQALSGLALVSTIEGKLTDAVKWGQAAVAANPDYAAGHLALGTAENLAASALRKQADATRDKEKGVDAATRNDLENQARQLEQQSVTMSRAARDAGAKAALVDKRLDGQQLTAAYSAWRYYSAGGRTPVLPQPK